MTSHQRERQAELRNRFTQLMGQPADEEQGAEEPAAAATEPEPAPPARRRRAPARQATKKTTHRPAAPAPMPIERRADTARPQRLMVPLSIAEDRTLKALRLEDGIAAAARIRAMLAVYQEDQRYRRKVDETARRMR